MKIEIVNGNIEEIKENLVLPIYEKMEFKSKIEALDNMVCKVEGKYNCIDQITFFDDSELKNIFVIGLGKKESINEDKLRILGGNVSRKLKNTLMSLDENINVNILLNDMDKNQVETFIEGILLGNYEFNKYKSSTKNKNKFTIKIYINNEINIEYDEVENLVNAITIARDLVNEPANVIYPETLASEVIKLGEEFGFEVEVYGEDKIKSLGMDAFLAVAKGSINKPRFIVMRYLGGLETEETLGLVGKGLTYDSGGYSIKPTSSMVDMKTDMAGAASVIGAMCAISKEKINKNVIAVIAACENTISNNSYKPGDIINSMGKKTIEILNTDAEGRLTLADAVYYIINIEKVNKVVDIATLTGAAISVLGSVATPVISNNDEFFSMLEESADKSGEKIWRLPIFDEYKKMIVGSDADIKNSGGREAGCITAGLFVGEFVGDTPWIHMDIAGTSTSSKTQGHKLKGATGEGVKTLYHLAKLLK